LLYRALAKDSDFPACIKTAREGKAGLQVSQLRETRKRETRQGLAQNQDQSMRDQLIETHDWIQRPINDFIDTMTIEQVAAMQQGEYPHQLQRYYPTHLPSAL
jgi:CHAT domain-containing protein